MSARLLNGLRWAVVALMVAGALLLLVFWWRHPELTEMELFQRLLGRP